MRCRGAARRRHWRTTNVTSSTRTMSEESGHTAIQLGGYTLSNMTGTAQHGLSHKMEPHSKERLCINVGEQMFAVSQADEISDYGSLYDIVRGLLRRLRLVGQGRVAHDSRCLPQTLKCLLCATLLVRS